MFRNFYLRFSICAFIAISLFIIIMVREKSDINELKHQLLESRKLVNEQNSINSISVDNKSNTIDKSLNSEDILNEDNNLNNSNIDNGINFNEDVSVDKLVFTDIQFRNYDEVNKLHDQTKHLNKISNSENTNTHRHKLYEKLDQADKKFTGLLPDIDDDNFYENLESLTQEEKEIWVSEMKRALEESNGIIDQLIESQ